MSSERFCIEALREHFPAPADGHDRAVGEAVGRADAAKAAVLIGGSTVSEANLLQAVDDLEKALDSAKESMTDSQRT